MHPALLVRAVGKANPSLRMHRGKAYEKNGDLPDLTATGDSVSFQHAFLGA
jgi:hypothetical protein